MTAESVTNPTDLALRLLEIVLYEDITKKDPLKSLIRLLETEDDASQQDKMTLYRDFLGSLITKAGIWEIICWARCVRPTISMSA